MSRFAPLPIAVMCMAVASCVTINVYFPAAAAEKAADKIIEDVWGGEGDAGSQKREDKRGDVDSAPLDPLDAGPILLAAAAVLELLAPSAHAQADLNISTPAVRQLTQSMEARHAQLKKYYDSGAVGLTRDGLIEIRDQNLVPLPERNAVRKLVADENADRASLYREIAAANNHPEWEPDIRRTFAERWISNAAPGWHHQDANGAWKQK
jgi:uncharacterized protein YdbL (DUF1318 family)